MVGIVTVVRVVFYSGSPGWSLVTGQYILDGKVVGKVRLVGAVYLVDWLDGRCGQIGRVVRMLESSIQDEYWIKWRYECLYAENKTKPIYFLHHHQPIFLSGHVYASVTNCRRLKSKGLDEMS